MRAKVDARIVILSYATGGSALPDARLPNGLTGQNVVGVTRGGYRATVYFNNGGRFTQSHKLEGNIGYHAPRGQHLYFGNVSKSVLDAFWEKANDAHPGASSEALYTHYQADLRSYFLDNPPRRAMVLPPPPNQNPKGLTLLEIREGGIHESRSALIPVSLVEANALVTKIRGRSANKRGPHWFYREYYFAKA